MLESTNKSLLRHERWRLLWFLHPQEHLPKPTRIENGDSDENMAGSVIIWGASTLHENCPRVLLWQNWTVSCEMPKFGRVQSQCGGKWSCNWLLVQRFVEWIWQIQEAQELKIAEGARPVNDMFRTALDYYYLLPCWVLFASWLLSRKERYRLHVKVNGSNECQVFQFLDPCGPSKSSNA